MLSELTIENFAIIERLVVRFSPGFTVLTGETGAGKSIIIDALQAVLGTRASADVVKHGAAFATVEAIFDAGVLDDPSLSTILRDYGIEDDDCLILRREISAAGRGSARVNGRAVPLAALATLGDRLVDIHGQSDHLSVLRSDRQLDVLDRYGELSQLRADVGEAIREFGRVRRVLQDLVDGQREVEQRLDLLRFQVSDIEGAQLRSGEEEELEAERNLLANAERLAQLSEVGFQALQGEAGSVLHALGTAQAATRDLSGIDLALASLDERVEAARYELEDIAAEIRLYRDSLEFDPERLYLVEERLDRISRLKRKYGASIEEVLLFGTRARVEMEEVQNLDERIAGLRGELEGAEIAAASLSEQLSNARRASAAALTVEMRRALEGLGLKGTDFQAATARREAVDGMLLSDGRRYAFTPSGIDSVQFLVSFNPSEGLRPLEKVASGGETSRFLLALKTVLASADQTPTLVFDEVDVGVGGRHGVVVGDRLKQLSGHHQVLSITHLPQVAVQADHHMIVEKIASSDRTTVLLRTLDQSDRIVEIAEMMSGTGTETARDNARELLEAAQRRRL